jgi:hypothetical protein
MGGFILPWAERLGYPIPRFDFRIPGVTSISADTHKFGYALKGTSVLLYRNSHPRSYQYFNYADWPGGIYLSPGLSGSRSGGLIASQAQDEQAALGGETGASAPGTAGEHGPPAPDEIAMPAQQGLGADEEAEPGRAGQASAETCKRQTISRPPARPLDLALEDAQLVPEDQELEAEAGVRESAIDEGIEEQTEDVIKKSESHDRAAWQVGSSCSASTASGVS